MYLNRVQAMQKDNVYRYSTVFRSAFGGDPRDLALPQDVEVAR